MKGRLWPHLCIHYEKPLFCPSVCLSHSSALLKRPKPVFVNCRPMRRWSMYYWRCNRCGQLMFAGITSHHRNSTIAVTMEAASATLTRDVYLYVRLSPRHINSPMFTDNATRCALNDWIDLYLMRGSSSCSRHCARQTLVVVCVLNRPAADSHMEMFFVR